MASQHGKEADTLETILTLTHARGLRRSEDREIIERFNRKPGKVGNPRRFGPRVRAEDARLHRLLGERVLMVSSTKRFASWRIISPDGPGRYRLMSWELMRTEGGVDGRLVPLPLIATDHFVERVLQSQARGVGKLVEVCIEVFDTLLGRVRTATGPGSERARWPQECAVSVALASGLVRASMPLEGDLVLRTVIAEPCLEYEPRLEWLALRHEHPPVELTAPKDQCEDEDGRILQPILTPALENAYRAST